VIGGGEVKSSLFWFLLVHVGRETELTWYQYISRTGKIFLVQVCCLDLSRQHYLFSFAVFEVLRCEQRII